MILDVFNAFYFDEIAILYFLKRSLLFAGKVDWEDGDVERILAAFFLYFFTNLEASLRFLMLYHWLYLELYFFHLIRYSIVKLRPFLIIRLLRSRSISELTILLLLIEIGEIY